MIGVCYFLLHAVVLVSKIWPAKSYDIRCPQNAEWNLRARRLCQSTAEYFCLLNPLKNSFEEGCTGPDWDRPGSKRVFQRNFNRGSCATNRFQPIKFSTKGNSMCIFKKSTCSEEGQVVSDATSTLSDSSCVCNYRKGYTFVTNPADLCYCNSFKEDCSCFQQRCTSNENGFKTEEECPNASSETAKCVYMTDSINGFKNESYLTYSNKKYDVSRRLWLPRYVMFCGSALCLFFLIVTLFCVLCCYTEKLHSRDIIDKQTDEEQIKKEFEQEVTNQKDDIKNVLQEKGLDEALRKLDKWKSESVKIAVIGPSGVGKSSFINAIRGLKPGDDGFAEVSSFGNTTKHQEMYEFPGNSKIQIYDLPGYGTARVSTKGYEKRVKNFDAALIFMRIAVLEDRDIEIANNLRQMNVPFCFVKSKFDEDLRNIKRDGLKEKNDVEEIMKYRICTSLRESKFADAPYFLISSKDTRIGDFHNLMDYLTNSLNETKKELIIISLLGSLSSDMIETKYNLLKKRIPKVALAAAGIAAAPVPGLDIITNTAIIINELQTYRTTFGFDQDIVQYEIKKSNLRKKLSANSILIQGTTSLPTFVASQLKAGLAIMTLQSYIDTIFLVIGSAISAATAGAVIYRFLNQILEACRNDAILVYANVYKTIENMTKAEEKRQEIEEDVNDHCAFCRNCI